MKPRLVAAAIALSVWAAFFFPFLGDVAPYYRDILRTDLPMRIFIGESLRSGQWPEWYPFEGLGLQFIGNAEGLFRPFTLLYVAIADPLSAMKLEIALASLLGLAGFYLLGRKLNLSRDASLFGAIGYAFSGYAVALQSNLPYLSPFHTVPWVLLAAAGALKSTRPVPWLVACSALWALVLLGGDPLLSVLLAAALLALVIACAELRRGARLLACVPFTAGLCLVWVLPAQSLFAESIRTTWTGERTGMSLHLARVPELLLGGFWLHRDQEMLLKGALDGSGELWASSIFLGASVLGLAAIGLWMRSRPALVWIALALLGTWAALGPEGGLYNLLRTVIPLLKFFRYPEKYLALATLGFTLAAAHGADALTRAPLRKASRGLIGVGLVCLAVLAAVAAFGFGLPSDLSQDLSLNWSLGAAVTLGFLALNLLAAPRISLAMPALLGLELHLATAHLSWTVPRSVIAAVPRFCRAAFEAGAGPSKARVLTDVATFPHIVSDIDGAAWTRATLNLMEPDNCSICGLEGIGTPNLSGVPARWWTAPNALPRKRVGHLFNAAVEVVEQPTQAPTLAEADGYALVRPAAAPLTRAFLARPVWVATPEAALNALATLPDGAAVVEGEAPGAAAAAPQGTVTVTSYAPTDVALAVEAQAPGLVVLNDLFSQGWTATLDGQETPILRANYLVRAVSVASGHHEIHYHYDTPRLRIGLTLTELTAAGALLLVLIESRRRRA